MIMTRFTKSVMENEEGMNHLWIQISPIGRVENVRVQIILPSGVYRLNNLNGFLETETAEIEVSNPSITNDIVIELFTRDPVMSGEKTVIIAVTYSENEDKHSRIEQYVPLKIVLEEEIDDVLIDAETLEKVKELQQKNYDGHNKEFVVYSPTKILRIDPDILSDLEKKYRID